MQGRVDLSYALGLGHSALDHIDHAAVPVEYQVTAETRGPLSQLRLGIGNVGSDISTLLVDPFDHLEAHVCDAHIDQFGHSLLS